MTVALGGCAATPKSVTFAVTWVEAQNCVGQPGAVTLAVVPSDPPVFGTMRTITVVVAPAPASGPTEHTRVPELPPQAPPLLLPVTLDTPVEGYVSVSVSPGRASP